MTDSNLIANPAAKTILDELIPEHVEKMVSTHFYRNIRFRRYANLAGIPESKLLEIAIRLKNLH